jgi:hypothetical protein
VQQRETNKKEKQYETIVIRNAMLDMEKKSLYFEMAYIISFFIPTWTWSL